jgi:hypothetical protein
MTHDFDLSTIRKTDGLLLQHVGSEILLYHEQAHQVFCLNAAASQVWQLLDSGGNIRQIAEAATLALRSPVDAEMVLFALDQFRRDGLIRETDRPLPPAIPSRRDLLQRLGAGAVMMVPVVAMVMAPSAAQAYNGCVDCVVPGVQQRGATALEQQNRTAQPQPPNPHSMFVP